MGKHRHSNKNKSKKRDTTDLENEVEDEIYGIFPDDKDILWYQSQLVLIENAIEDTKILHENFKQQLEAYKKQNPLLNKFEKYMKEKDHFSEIFSKRGRNLHENINARDLLLTLGPFRMKLFLKIKSYLQKNMTEYQRQLSFLEETYTPQMQALQNSKLN